MLPGDYLERAEQGTRPFVGLLGGRRGRSVRGHPDDNRAADHRGLPSRAPWTRGASTGAGRRATRGTPEPQRSNGTQSADPSGAEARDESLSGPSEPPTSVRVLTKLVDTYARERGLASKRVGAQRTASKGVEGLGQKCNSRHPATTLTREDPHVRLPKRCGEGRPCSPEGAARTEKPPPKR